MCVVEDEELGVHPTRLGVTGSEGACGHWIHSLFTIVLL